VSAEDDLTLDQLMVWLKITPSDLIRLVAYHQLPHHLVDGQVRFSRAAVEHWADEHRKLFILKNRQT
jgi:hypothetical protein